MASKQDAQYNVCMRCSEAKNPREIITDHYVETYCMASSVTTDGRCTSVTGSFPGDPYSITLWQVVNHFDVQYNGVLKLLLLL